MAGSTPARGAVSVLYVDPRGPYPRLVDDWWGEDRNAKLYAGPRPVVAHPPCGPWSDLHALCFKQDPTCFPAALEVVRRFGGVLEHPATSRAFRAFGVPWPDEFPDAWGGRSYFVNQLAWGHPCSKPTWLYVVGVSPAVVAAGIRTGGRRMP